MRRLSVVLTLALAVSAGPLAVGAGAMGPAAPGWPDLNHDRRVVEAYYRDHPELRDQFGGLYEVRRGEPDTLHIMVTDRPPVRPYPWEADIGNPDQLRVQGVEFSERYLHGIQWKIGRAWSNDPPYTRGMLELSVDVKGNTVDIGTRSGWAPKGFWDHFGGRFPRRAVDFFQTSPARLG